MLVVVMVAFAAPARAQTGFPRELQVVDKVNFSGRHHVPKKELKSVIKTGRRGQGTFGEKPVLRLDFLRADTLAILGVYRQHGFLDAQVTTRIRPRKEPGQAEVDFVIAEGKTSVVRNVTFEGVRAFNESQLVQLIYAHRGRAFNPSALILDTLRIAEAYQDRGYRPRVSADFSREGLDVSVHYTVQEGPLYRLGQVDYSSAGPLSVRRSLIEREFELRPGDIYRRSQMQRTIDHLYSTNLFRSIQATPLPDSANALMEVDMRLEERMRHWIDASVGSGTAERLSFIASWGKRNLWEQGYSGSLASRLSLDDHARFLLWRTEASLLSPWVFGRRTPGQVTTYYEQSDDWVSDPRWVLEKWAPGIRFQLSREFSRILRLTATQDNVLIHQSVRFRIPQPPQQLVDSLFENVPAQYSTHLLNLSLDRDLRDDPLVTHHGSAQSVSGEAAGVLLRRSSSYVKGQFASAWFTPVRRTWLLATQVRAGMMAPFGPDVRYSPQDSLVDAQVARVPLERRFRLGGVNSVRGFSETALVPNGGLAMVQANAELRIPVVGPVGLELFVDGGNVWPGASHIRLSDFAPYAGPKPVEEGDMRYVFGLGPRVVLPFGPLRLDFTWSPRPIDPQTHQWFVHELQFAIGPAF
jgi:outer membrane protein insertion porin family